MGDAGKILVDTSAWVEYFAGREAVVRMLNEPIDDDRIVMCGQIKQELLQGTRDERAFTRLERAVSIWAYEAETPADFREAARMWAQLRWKGVTVPAADCLIAALAKRCGLAVCATDPHFGKIAGLRVIAPTGR